MYHIKFAIPLTPKCSQIFQLQGGFAHDPRPEALPSLGASPQTPFIGSPFGAGHVLPSHHQYTPIRNSNLAPPLIVRQCEVHTMAKCTDCLCIDKISLVNRNLYILFALVNFINPSVNPFIYAARYEVFRRFLKQKLNKGIVGSSNANQAAASTTNQSAATRQTA